MAKDGRTDIPSEAYKRNWNDIFGNTSKAEDNKSKEKKGSKNGKGSKG
jgi:hypothetical protein